MAWSLQYRLPELFLETLEAWALRTEPLGEKVACPPDESTLSPELPRSSSGHGSGELGPGRCVSPLTQFLRWTPEETLGHTSSPAQEREKAANPVGIRVLLDL